MGKSCDETESFDLIEWGHKSISNSRRFVTRRMQKTRRGGASGDLLFGGGGGAQIQPVVPTSAIHHNYVAAAKAATDSISFEERGRGAGSDAFTNNKETKRVVPPGGQNSIVTEPTDRRKIRGEGAKQQTPPTPSVWFELSV
ncbi:hypothetical protein GPALN_016358 [Globodera pallida]|nr:hypothetical protein GPALN_016358 [Globodera pallida]